MIRKYSAYFWSVLGVGLGARDSEKTVGLTPANRRVPTVLRKACASAGPAMYDAKPL